MYCCELCREVVKAGTEARRAVIRTRTRTYPERRNSQPPGARKHRSNRKHWRDDPGGAGQEIVREVLVCPHCERRDAAAS